MRAQPYIAARADAAISRTEKMISNAACVERHGAAIAAKHHCARARATSAAAARAAPAAG